MNWFVDKLGPAPKPPRGAKTPSQQRAMGKLQSQPQASQAPQQQRAAVPTPPAPEEKKKKKGWF